MSSEIRSTPLPGVFEVISDVFLDRRGAFLNAFRSQEDAFKYIWKQRNIAQVNISRTEIAGTVRGLHLQTSPFSEAQF